jgi:uncharacterized protein (DUF1697 family)
MQSGEGAAQGATQVRRPMTTYVALLYSIILGAGRRLVMTDLKAMAEDIGLVTPRTLVATGNLVFEAADEPADIIESRLEAAFARRFGRQVDIIVRDAEGWRRLVDAVPFPQEAATDAPNVAVRVMRRPIGTDVVAALEARLAPGEKLRVVDGDPWLYFPHGASRSRLAPLLGSRKSCGIGTSRNWNTIRRLGDMVG